jgi:hypothetical protein
VRDDGEERIDAANRGGGLSWAAPPLRANAGCIARHPVRVNLPRAVSAE